MQKFTVTNKELLERFPSLLALPDTITLEGEPVEEVRYCPHGSKACHGCELQPKPSEEKVSPSPYTLENKNIVDDLSPSKPDREKIDEALLTLARCIDGLEGYHEKKKDNPRIISREELIKSILNHVNN